jgi:hypothetical protein
MAKPLIFEANETARSKKATKAKMYLSSDAGIDGSDTTLGIWD